MIQRSFDRDLLLKATESVRELCPPKVLDEWWSDPRHMMFVESGNVGLATFEYPGLYNVHWYFKDRGRKAIDTAKRMIENLFVNYDAKAVRGVIRTDLKASRWACRQVGLKSYGIIDGNELFHVTKEDFLKGLDNG